MFLLSGFTNPHNPVNATRSHEGGSLLPAEYFMHEEGTIKIAYWIEWICCFDVFLWCVLYDSFSCSPRDVKRTWERIQNNNKNIIQSSAFISHNKYKALELQSAPIVWYWYKETQCNGFDIACGQQGRNKWKGLKEALLHRSTPITISTLSSAGSSLNGDATLQGIDWSRGSAFICVDLLSQFITCFGAG